MGFDASLLPTLNAALNTLALLLLVAGYVAIRRRRIGLHRRFMLSAFTVSGMFLVSYVTYHTLEGSRRFPGEGPIRLVYFAILVTHVVLAIAIVPMVLVTLRRALGADYLAHRRIARRTLPLWLYVSVTGVVVYVMLYVAFS